MTVQKTNFLNMTSTHRLRGAGAQYRRDVGEMSILLNSLEKNKRVGLRQKGQIDFSRLQNRYMQYEQNDTGNEKKSKADWKEGVKQGLTLGASGALAGLTVGGPIGAAIGGGIGLIVGAVKGLFFS